MTRFLLVIPAKAGIAYGYGEGPKGWSASLLKSDSCLRRNDDIGGFSFVIPAKAGIACRYGEGPKGWPASSLKSDSCLRRNDDIGRFFIRHPGEGRDRVSLWRGAERMVSFVVEERFLPSQE